MELALTDEQRLGSAVAAGSELQRFPSAQAAALLLQSLNDPEVKDPMLGFLCG